MTETYSTSRLNTASDCEYKYYLRYFKKLYPSIELSFFLVGNTVHKIIEDFYRSRIYQPIFTKEQQLAWCKEKLDKSFQYKFGKDVFGMFQTYQEAKAKALSHVVEQTNKEARPTATKLWKENFEESFNKQAEAVNMFAENKCQNIVFKKSFVELYEQCLTCLNNFVDIHQQAPNNPRAVIHEFRLDPPLVVFGHNKGGRVDRIDMKVSDEGKVSYSVYDYKTGKLYWKEEGLPDNDQLCWYSLGLKETYGVLPETVGVMDLYHNKIVAGSITQDDIDKYLKRLQSQLEAVTTLEESFQQEESTIPFKTPITKGESYKCRSCEYSLDPSVKCKFQK